eukprot:11353636-Alexandrium_andersonii.AAC.1
MPSWHAGSRATRPLPGRRPTAQRTEEATGPPTSARLELTRLHEAEIPQGLGGLARQVGQPPGHVGGFEHP